MDDKLDSRPDYFVLEYSPSQDAWHIQHIEDLIYMNLLAYIDEKGARDFMLMGVASTSEELVLLQEEIQKTYQKIHPEPDPYPPSKKRSLMQRIRLFFKQ